MDDLDDLVRKSQAGDALAYGEIIQRFQDMAFGLAFARLRDFHSAEDAAQEAFVRAWRSLADLREPSAFGGWLRSIVLSQCDHLTRRKVRRTTGLTSTGELPSRESGPFDRVSEHEARDSVLNALERLTEAQRVVTTLYYISGHDTARIAGFLGVPVTTVKKRLHDARQRLREELLGMVEDNLGKRAPSRRTTFAAVVMAYIEDPRGRPDLADAGVVDRLLAAIKDGALARVGDHLQEDNGRGDPLTYWLIKYDRTAVDGFLRSHGPSLDILVASSFGQVERVTELLRQDPEVTHVTDKRGWFAIDRAAHEGHTAVVKALLDGGADPNGKQALYWASQNGFVGVARLLLDAGAKVNHPEKSPPLGRAVYRNRPDVVRLLLAHGARPHGVLGGAAYGSRTRGKVQIMEYLLERGADVNERGDDGHNALYAQIWFYGDGPDKAITDFLISRGAEVDIFNASGLGLIDRVESLLHADPALVKARSGHGGFTPLHYAAVGNQYKVAEMLLARGAEVNATATPESWRKRQHLITALDLADYEDWGTLRTCDNQPLQALLRGHGGRDHQVVSKSPPVQSKKKTRKKK